MCRRDFRNITGRSMPALAGHWLRENRALVTGEFQRDEMVCTKTLYNYVTLGLLGKIKSIVARQTKKRQEAGS